MRSPPTWRNRKPKRPDHRYLGSVGEQPSAELRSITPAIPSLRGAGAVDHDGRNRFLKSIARWHAGCLQARQPRDRDEHDLFALRPSASRRHKATGGLVSVRPDLYPRRRHGSAVRAQLPYVELRDERTSRAGRRTFPCRSLTAINPRAFDGRPRRTNDRTLSSRSLPRRQCFLADRSTLAGPLGYQGAER